MSPYKYTLLILMLLFASCKASEREALPRYRKPLPSKYARSYQYYYIQDGDTLYFSDLQKFYPLETISNPYK